MNGSKIETWIKAGYKLLGTEGIDGIKIERLARILKLNKSGFYYYFGGMKPYVKSLLQYHVGLAHEVAGEIAKCESIDPDLLLIVVKHKPFFLVESQLAIKCKTAQFIEDCDEASNIINQQLLPLWKKNNDLPEDSTVALAYLNIVRHFFYARIDSENINYEFLHSLTVETRDVLDKVTVEKHISPQNMRDLNPS
jgi:AcrR family transcriptional regulator